MLLKTDVQSHTAGVAVSPLTILVLCTGNSARSLMAEALFNHLGKPWIRAVSAGSHPVGRVNPFALEQIRTHLGDDGSSYRSKSWDQFSQTHSDEPIDVVLTVCANAAQERCPVFPGAALHVHWGFADPAAAPAEVASAAFAATFDAMRARIESLRPQLQPELTAQALADRLRALA